MSEHQIETAFLKHLIRYDDSDECRKLERSLVQVQADVRSVQRIAAVTALSPLLAIAVFAYGVLLEEHFPYNKSELVPVFRILCELGLASLICLVGLAGLLMVYRKKLNRLRKECLQSVIRLLESHLGKPRIPMLPSSPRVIDNGEVFHGATAASVVAGSPSLI
jgi:hypothetical protein